MILSKLWFDLRWRFLFCIFFVAFGVMALIFLFPVLRPGLLWLKADISPEDWAVINPLLSSYRLFMDHGWFGEVEKVAGFAIILALGGIMTERSSHTALFSLSLPVSRRKWILYQAAFVFVLVLVMCCMATFMVLVGGWIYGSSYPIGRAIQGTILLALLTIPWIGATFALTSIIQEKLRTAVLIFAIWIVTGVLGRLSDVRVWMPRHLLDYFAGAPFPWQALIVIVVFGIGGLILAIQQFEARDF